MTPKQEQFVREYLIDLNATQAAIRCGYSAKTAHAQGSRLLSNAEIVAAIDAGKIERSEETKIDAAWVLKRLADEAVADINDIYDDDGELLPVKKWPLIWRQGLVQGIEVEELFGGRGEDRKPVGVVRKVKLSDRIRRVELIGKHVSVKAFEEQIALAGLEALADRLARASKREGR